MAAESLIGAEGQEENRLTPHSTQTTTRYSPPQYAIIFTLPHKTLSNGMEPNSLWQTHRLTTNIDVIDWKAIDSLLCSNWTLTHHFWILDRNLCVNVSSDRLTCNREHKPYAPLSACFFIRIFRWESSFVELTVALILNHLHWFEAVLCQYLALVVSLCSLRPDDVTSFCLLCHWFLESRFVHLIWLLRANAAASLRETQRCHAEDVN